VYHMGVAGTANSGLRFGSLFAGVGGFDLGLERAGWRCGWQVEVDEFASTVLALRWPGVARCGDVRDCGAVNLGEVDLICGGFPCQDVSYAGSRVGLNGERSGLWSEFARIIRELRPRWVLVENVPGLLTVDGGRAFGRVLRDLAECGYDAEWDCLPAAAFGAPHLRKRLCILAYPDGMGGPKGPVAFQPGLTTSILAEGDRNRAGIWAAANCPAFRMADGVSGRLDRYRMRCLGNAVVPQVVEWIGRRVVEVGRVRDRAGDCPGDTGHSGVHQGGGKQAWMTRSC